jgi:hypothetical protein
MNGFLFYLKAFLDRINRIFRILFCHFPEENDKIYPPATEVSYNACKIYSSIEYLLVHKMIFYLPKLVGLFAEGDGVFFVSSGNKE